MFAPAFEPILNYKVYNFHVPRNSIPTRTIDNNYPMDDRVFFKVISICPSVSFSSQAFDDYSITFKHWVDRLAKTNSVYPIHFIYRTLFNNAIAVFPTMTNWRNLFENHYNAALKILQKKSPEICFEKTYSIIETFVALAEEYLLDHIHLVFHLPINTIDSFAKKYPKHMYEAALKKSQKHWIDEKSSAIACKPYFLQLWEQDILGIICFASVFPPEICMIIHDYLVTNRTPPSKSFVEYFNEMYNYAHEEVRYEYAHAVKLVKRCRIPNARMSYNDTISVQIFDDFSNMS